MHKDYDNWNTIIYWCKTDPHVYDKCVINGCSKTVNVTPNDDSIKNGVFNSSDVRSDPYADRTFGDGYSYIIRDRQWNMDMSSWPDNSTKGQGYATSLIRATLIGSDSHTNATASYTRTDAQTKYTSTSCIFACFPSNLQNAIVAKKLSPTYSIIDYRQDSAGLEDVCDKLWLFSATEMNSPRDNTLLAHYGINSFYASLSSQETDNATRASHFTWWLRSGYNVAMSEEGGTDYSFDNANAVAPGFLLPAKSQS